VEEPKLSEVVTSTLLVTPSGALSPGLLSAAAIAAGTSLGPLGGLLVALGHTLVELPYVGVLALTLSKVREKLTKFKKPLSLLVLAFALFFAWGTVGSGMPKIGVTDALVAGVVFTASNFYFLLWWATVGLPLLEKASVSRKHFVTMYVSHVWMDYVWLALLAAFGYALARSVIGPYFNAALALLMVIFALDVVLKSFTGKGILPG
jgi:threonine/homoserine/homoserine lactone efflux protein